MLRDGRIGGVGQPDFTKAGSASAHRHFVGSGQRKESAGQQLNHFVARQLAAEHLPYHRASSTQNVDRNAIEIVVTEQALFGRRTQHSQGMTLAQAELGLESLFHSPRQRQVEIFAAQQQVLANGGTFELHVVALRRAPAPG